MRYRRHPIVVGFTKGATAAAAGAIVGAAAVIGTQVIVDVTAVVIFLAALVVLWRTKLPEPLLVGAAGIIGLITFAFR
jgi:chromate transporter